MLFRWRVNAQQKAIFSVNFITVGIKRAERFSAITFHNFPLWSDPPWNLGQDSYCLNGNCKKSFTQVLEDFFRTRRRWWPLNLERLLLWRRLFQMWSPCIWMNHLPHYLDPWGAGEHFGPFICKDFQSHNLLNSRWGCTLTHCFLWVSGCFWDSEPPSFLQLLVIFPKWRASALYAG